VKVDMFTRVLLTIIAVALCAIAFRPFVVQKTVSAQTSGARFGYLYPMAGNTSRGGQEFIDLRSGNSWDCKVTDCKLEGRYPLEQIK